MPFLDEDILLGLLRTYPGAEEIENKSKSPAKDKSSSMLQLVKDSARSSALFLKDKTSSTLGYNTSADSEACYLEIKNRIKEAAKANKPEAWVNLLGFLGEIGYHTHTTSFSEVGSTLFRTVFAILMDIRNQVTEKASLTETTSEEDKKYRQFALDIQEAIKLRIEKYNQIVKNAQENIKHIKELDIGFTIANKLTINTTKVKNSETSSKDIIDIVQRHLYYLGEDPPVNEAYTKPAQEIFWKFTLYTDAVRKKYNLSTDQVDKIKVKIHLPLQLHTIYPTLYIRDYATELKKVINDMDSFEKLERIKIAESKSSGSSISNTRTPSTTTPKHPELKITPPQGDIQPITAIRSPHAEHKSLLQLDFNHFTESSDAIQDRNATDAHGTTQEPAIVHQSTTTDAPPNNNGFFQPNYPGQVNPETTDILPLVSSTRLR